MTNKPERDELARIIHKALSEVTGIYDTTDTEDQELADAILAAGYRKPRTITNWKELDALPCGSIVRDVGGLALRRNILGWNATNGARHLGREELEQEAFPVVVLWVGGADE